jgi:hypothetical protein
VALLSHCLGQVRQPTILDLKVNSLVSYKLYGNETFFY